MSDMNHRWRLASRPTGMVGREHFSYGEEPIPTPGDGELLIKVSYLSLDPAMRGWLRDVKSYIEPVGIGDVMRALGLGKVVTSNHPKFAQGDWVTGLTGVQEYALSDGKGLQKVDPNLAPLTTYMSTLGMPGMTAYFGFLDVGQPKNGETVVVSGAAGAVGSVVGQIAKIKGCRAVGIAGGPEKCKYLIEELGYDAAIDYKSEDVYKALKEKCPGGIDVYFDNVGGDILDAALSRINMHARIVVCGAISQYNSEQMKGPANYLQLLVKRARMEGMVVFDYASRYRDAAMEMGGWMMSGQLKTKAHIEKGIERFPEILQMLFTGKNFGKLILQVTDA